MELRKGFKQTEVGVIPDDWNVKSLGCILKIIGGGAFKSDDSSKEGIRWLKIANVGVNETIWDDESFLPIGLINNNETFLLKESDYVLALTRPILDRKLKITKLNKSDVPALLNQRVGRIEVESQNDPDFAYFLLQKFDTINAMLQSMAGTDPPNLSSKGIYRIPCPTPPTKSEQTAIATALSDADALITSLEKLITKKRNIKQGAMQQLLKPKKGWIAKRLPDVVWFQEGPGVRNSQFKISGVKLLNGTNIQDGKLVLEKTDRYISQKEAYGWYSHFLVEAGDILIACSGVTIDKFEEKVTIATKFHLPLCMNTSTMRFKITSNNLYKAFFYHFLKSKSFKDQIGGKATGSAQLNFGPAHVKMVEILLPELKEQEAIANMFSDMDDEIGRLESMLGKFERIKGGMMENLLTGKIRLI